MSTLNSCLLALFASGVLGEDESAALDRYKQASQAKETALVALERAYVRIEKAWTEWRAAESSREPALADFLAGRCEESARSLAERRAANPGKEARSARRLEIEELTKSCRAALEERELAEPALRETLADAAAREAAGRATVEEIRTRLAPLVTTWLGPDQRFELLWNEHLYANAEEVRSFRERYDEYIAAGAELDRVRHPESYLPGGEKTRPRMVYVPGGNYTVGPNSGFERKKRKVTLRPFLIDQCEVSNADYLTFIESFAADQPEQRLAHTPRHWKVGPEGRARPAPEQMDHPVTGVTWRDADAYARFVGKRLPSEDEWEVACRGREAFAYPWGEQYVDGRCNDAKLNLGMTVPVTRFEEGASPFKALNLAGNVAEWTCSLEEGETFTELPSNIAAVVVRGGHYQSPADNVGGLFRWVAPGGSSREPYLGFRCVADLK